MLRKIIFIGFGLLAMQVFASEPTQNKVTAGANETEKKVTAVSKPDYIFTEDKKNIVVTADHPQFILKLKSNPTTGYSWFLRDLDYNIIAPVKHVFQKPTTKLIGSPSFELWTFRVKPTGFIVPTQTTLRMMYARPWQGNDGSTQIIFHVSTEGK